MGHDSQPVGDRASKSLDEHEKTIGLTLWLEYWQKVMTLKGCARCDMFFSIDILGHLLSRYHLALKEWGTFREVISYNMFHVP